MCPILVTSLKANPYYAAIWNISSVWDGSTLSSSHVCLYYILSIEWSCAKYWSLMSNSLVEALSLAENSRVSLNTGVSWRGITSTGLIKFSWRVFDWHREVEWALPQSIQVALTKHPHPLSHPIIYMEIHTPLEITLSRQYNPLLSHWYPKAYQCQTS